VIGPLTTVIAYLAHELSQLDGRVAARHRFALADAADGSPRGWPDGAAALTLRLAGGDPDRTSCADGGLHRVRLETRCWGADSVQAEQTWVALVALCSGFQRTAVALPTGETALLQALAIIDGPFGETDIDTGIDIVRGTIAAHVAAQPVA
jgi:hypothetical protein